MQNLNLGSRDPRSSCLRFPGAMVFGLSQRELLRRCRRRGVWEAPSAAVAPPAHNDNEVLAQIDGRWRVLWSPTPLDLTCDLVRACAAEAAHLAPPVEDGEWQVWRDDVTGQHYWLVVRHDAVGLMQTANGWEVVYEHDFERDHSQ